MNGIMRRRRFRHNPLGMAQKAWVVFGVLGLVLGGVSLASYKRIDNIVKRGHIQIDLSQSVPSLIRNTLRAQNWWPIRIPIGKAIALGQGEPGAKNWFSQYMKYIEITVTDR
jgi:hypothetical protein